MAEVVVFVTGQDPLTGLGGGSNYVRAHARASQAAGFKPHVFCAFPRSELIDADFGVIHRVESAWSRNVLLKFPPGNSDGLVARWLLGFVHSPYTVMLHGPWLARNIEQFLLQQRAPHLIHGFYTWGSVGLKVKQVLRRKGIETIVINSFYTTVEDETRAKLRNICHAHSWTYRLLLRGEALWNRYMTRPYERFAYTGCQVVLVNYESVRRLFLAEHGLGAETRRLTYGPEMAFLQKVESACDPENRSSSHPREAPLLLTLSRHDPRKGLDVLLRALAQLRAAGQRFRLCMLSGGPLLAAHQRLAAELGLADFVEFTDWVPSVSPYFRRADVFVLPSIQEGSGSIALLEALQAGIPCIASACDGIPEDVTDGYDALLVPPGDTVALAAAVKRLLEDPPLRERLGVNARATFKRKFSAQAFSREIGVLYSELRASSTCAIPSPVDLSA